MALTLSDVTTPTGQLYQGLFPGDDEYAFNSRIGAWLSAGTDQAAGVPWADRRDEAVRAYVYWQGYDAVATRMATTPASVTNPDQQGGWAFTAAQLDRVAVLAGQWHDAFDAILASVPSPVLAPVRVGPPASVPLHLHF